MLVLNESPEHFKNQENLLDEPERLATKDSIKILADSLEQFVLVAYVKLVGRF